jgi:hypothetical protein
MALTRAAPIFIRLSISPSGVATAPSTASASMTLRSDGVLLNKTTNVGKWLIGSNSGSGYEVQATVISGTITGTTGSFLALSSNQTWSLSSNTPGNYSTTVQFDFRRAGSTTIMYTAQVIFSIFVDIGG